MIVMVLVGVVVPAAPAWPEPAALATLALQFPHSLPALRRFRDRWGRYTLAAQLVLLPVGGAAPLAAGSALVVPPPRWRWPLYGGAVAAAGLLSADEGGYACASATGNAAFFGLLIFALSRLTDLRARLEETRDELAARRVAAERDRVSRALEDALGAALSEVIRLAAAARPAEIMRITAAARARVRQAPAQAAPDDPSPAPGDLTPKHALPVLVGSSLWYPVIATVFVLGERPPAAVAAVYVADIVLVVALHLYHIVPRPNGVRPRHAAWTLPLLLVAAGWPLFAPDQAYPQLLWYAGGSIPVLLYGTRACWPVLAAYLALVPAVLPLRGADAGTVAVGTLQAVVTPWMYFALFLFTRLVYEIRETRHSLAQLAVSRERRRIDRDVHDLLGAGLWAIMVKTDAASRDPSRAPRELADVAAIARRALADLRAIPTEGDVDLDSGTELASAREILTAAGVDVRVDWAPGPLPGPADALLAIVLREGVTNVLRHSEAAECAIEASRTATGVRVRIANDGASPAREAPGQGTANLTARTASLGGRLAAARDGTRYELVADLPLTADRSPAA